MWVVGVRLMVTAVSPRYLQSVPRMLPCKARPPHHS